MLINNKQVTSAGILLKDTEKHVTCPHSSCECTSFWDYIKYDNTNNRS